ncbi:hypothetical protein EYC80_001105 [Monilinia laxa]|uniref:Uncharacterized protein n=1 Tax=Monilinia laxa TaxID=61186 RepID=A0A5N6K859_MONLA|nr:hypothetical protein EYC80_001105 [Monilinia laxa]
MLATKSKLSPAIPTSKPPLTNSHFRFQAPVHRFITSYAEPNIYRAQASSPLQKNRIRSKLPPPNIRFSPLNFDSPP